MIGGRRSGCVCLAGLLLAATFSSEALAQNQKAAEQCREKLRPAVQGCVKQQVQAKGGPPAKHVEACRQQHAERVPGVHGSGRRQAVEAGSPSGRAKARTGRSQQIEADARTSICRPAAHHCRYHGNSESGKARRSAHRATPRGGRCADSVLRQAWTVLLLALPGSRQSRPPARRDRRLREGDRRRRRLSPGGQPLSAIPVRPIPAGGGIQEVDRSRAGDVSASIERWSAPGAASSASTFASRSPINQLGERQQADDYFRRNQALLQESRGWQNVEMYRSSWASVVENGNARMLEVAWALRGSGDRVRAGADAAARCDREVENMARAADRRQPGIDRRLHGGVRSPDEISGRAAWLTRRPTLRRALLSRLEQSASIMPSTAYISTIFVRAADRERTLRGSGAAGA